MQSTLHLQKLRLPVHLGWTAEERAVLQDVYIDIRIRFKQPPESCATDELSHTLCYDALTQQLTRFVANNEYRLIEYLNYALFQQIQSLLTPGDYLEIALSKSPPMDHLDTATFTLSREVVA